MLKHLYTVGLFRNNFYEYIKHKTARKMGDTAQELGVPLQKIVSSLRKIADMSLAASWDNVGLLIEPTESKMISCILLTNDLTEDVMDEAVKLKSNLIVTYHPLIFTPLKSITTRYWKVTVRRKYYNIISFSVNYNLISIYHLYVTGTNSGKVSGKQNRRLLTAHQSRFRTGWRKRLASSSFR